MDKFASSLSSTEAILRHGVVISGMRRAWGKLDEVELAAIKNRADLVMQVQANYGLDKNQARAAVDLWATGQAF